jgi:cell division protein FtsI (penicillin-binding protein 3)/stage V sporulation protein D (sporulation-specific penicillin-binding protein)
MRPHQKLLFRIRLIGAGATLVALLLIGKLYIVQLLHGDEYREKADRQYASSGRELWDRGSIFFETRNGDRVSAATLQSGVTLAVNPKEIIDVEALYARLAQELPLERTAFLAKAGKKNDPYEEIARRVPEERARRLGEEKLSGVSLSKERWRLYPGGTLAAHLLGFVGSDGDALAGRYGLERYYDDVLSRQRGGLYRNFFAEIFSGIKRAVGPERLEGDVITSIEPSVEQVLEDTLSRLAMSFSTRRTGGIIMDPGNGRIYAMALSPSFDPNEFGKEADQSRFSNALVESVYEMGSILKPLTLAAGLDAGLITATSTYNDAGSLTLSGKTISNFDGKGRGRVSMQEVLNQSLNTGAATVALKLGKERFLDYFTRFGLGEETGIDLPAEAEGLIRNLASGRDIELATASYGQGVALTPIQTVRALASLGNGGYLVTPHVATKIAYKTGITRSIESTEKRQALKPETSEEISRMLAEVVDTALLGGQYRMPHHSIAAKTGTALIADPEHGGYYADRFLHAFFGYVPAYSPRFIVFLYAVEPKGVAFASHTLTAPFMEIVKFLINYYEIPPDR